VNDEKTSPGSSVGQSAELAERRNPEAAGSNPAQGLSQAGISYEAILETDGPLEGVLTAIGIVTDDRESLKPILGGLRPWRAPK
jgi:hypothetical protein